MCALLHTTFFKTINYLVFGTTNLIFFRKSSSSKDLKDILIILATGLDLFKKKLYANLQTENATTVVSKHTIDVIGPIIFTRTNKNHVLQVRSVDILWSSLVDDDYPKITHFSMEIRQK